MSVYSCRNRVMSSAAPTVTTARTNRHTCLTPEGPLSLVTCYPSIRVPANRHPQITQISVNLWPFYLLKKESLNRYSMSEPDTVVQVIGMAISMYRIGLRNLIHRGEIMKKLFSVIAMGCLLSLLLVGSVQAQLPGSEIRASIPFDFTVRGVTLPAGEYTITRIGDEPAS